MKLYCIGFFYYRISYWIDLSTLFLCVSRMELYYLLSWRTFSQQHLKSKMLDESIILHIYWNRTCSTFEYLIMLVYMESVGKSCDNSSNLLIVRVVFYSGFVTDIFILPNFPLHHLFFLCGIFQPMVFRSVQRLR